MAFVIFSPFLLILIPSFSIGTVKVMYFSVFFPKYVNIPQNLLQAIQIIIIVRSIVKNYSNFLRYTIFQIKYVMCSTSVFICIMAMISNIFYI